MTQERLSNLGIMAATPPEAGSGLSKEVRWAFSAASMTISSSRLLDRLNMVDKDDGAILRISMAERLSRGKVNELTRRTGIRKKLSESSIRRHMLAYEEIAGANAKLKGQYKSEEDLIRVKAISDAAYDFVRRVEQTTERAVMPEIYYEEVSDAWIKEWSLRIYPPRDLFAEV